MTNSKISKGAWVGFCLFALGYVANSALSQSDSIREENFPLAVGLLGLFSALTIIGIILPVKSAVIDSDKIEKLEERIKKLEDAKNQNS